MEIAGEEAGGDGEEGSAEAGVPRPPPTAAQVARRAIVLRALNEAAWRFPRAGEKTASSARDHFEAQRTRLVGWLQREGAWALARPEERAFLSAPVGTGNPADLPDSTNRRETLMVLLWALGYLEAIPEYDTPAPTLALLAREMPIKIGARTAEFIRRAELRPPQDLELARETAELWHLRALARETVAGKEYPTGEELEALAEDLREEARIIRFKLGPIKDGPSFFRELIRYTAHYAHHMRGLIPPPIGEDFPALEKKYGDLGEEEFQLLGALAAHRHAALSWLGGRP